MLLKAKSKMKPLVSIIIPTYNRANIIHETLNSLLDQTYNAWECILVDDGSTDETILRINEYIDKDNRFRLFKRSKSRLKGPSACRNIGLENAKGNYIIFLDSDDLLAPFCLEQRILAFEKNLDNDFLVFKMERFIETPRFKKHKPLEEISFNHISNVSSLLQLESIWQVTSPIYKRSFINTEKIKCFNEHLINLEDLEYALKIVLKTESYKLFNNKDCFYRNDVNYKKKYNSLSVKEKTVNAFSVFLKEIHLQLNNISEVSLKKYYKKQLVLGYQKIFLINIKDNIANFKNQNKVMLSFLILNNYLSLNQKLRFFFVQFILFKFHKIKRIGVYRLIKFLYTIN